MAARAARDVGIEMLCRKMVAAIKAAPPEQRAAQLERFEVWADWHIPRTLRAAGIKAPSPLGGPARPISVREARILHDLEARFAAAGYSLADLRRRLSVKRRSRGGR
jgi:hypothetical protein